MTDTIDKAEQTQAEKLSRSEQRKKNRQDNKGQKKTESHADHKEGLFTRIYNFFVEAKQELLKVVWPTKKETIDTTWRLLILVVLAGIYLGLVDGILSRLLGLLV